MKARLLTSLVGIPLLFAVFFASHTLVWEIAIAAVGVIGILELIKCTGLRSNFYIAIIDILYAVAFIIFANSSYKFLFSATAIYILLLLFGCIISKNNIDLSSVALLGVMTVYVTNGFASLVILRRIEIGFALCWLVFISAWISDAFAYFTGRLFGKHKLLPEISPKKTVEGAIGGAIFAGIGFIVFGFISIHAFKYETNILALAISGVLLSIVGQIGDLLASAVKRHLKIKDFGNLLPGHGGVLDRFDSIIAIAPILLTIEGMSDLFYLLK